MAIRSIEYSGPADRGIGKIILFPLNPSGEVAETTTYGADRFQMGLYWLQEETPAQNVSVRKPIPITLSLDEADDLSYEILLEQEIIEPEAPAYGVHPQRRRYKESGFPKWEWNHDFGVKK